MNPDLDYFKQSDPPLNILQYLGKGKSGHSYLADQDGKKVVLKMMHDEPCAYYKFSEHKVLSEINAFHILQEIGIIIPELIRYDIKKNYLVKDYICGPTAARWLIAGANAERVLPQLFQMAQKAKHNRINIDYFPTNFVIHQGNLFYIDYEINQYAEEWNLENWGLYYWANREGLAEYFRDGNSLAINISVETGKPIIAPFIDQVSEWKKKFSPTEK